MKKKQYSTKQQAEIAAKIIKKAVEISNNTPHDVFVYYYPHIDRIDVQIHICGWIEGKGYDSNPSVGFEYWRDTEAELAEVMAELDELQKDAKK